MGLATTLYDERLDALLIEVVDELWQGALVCQDDALGIRTVPVANGQLRVFADVSGMSHEDGILLSTQLVGEHLCLFVADLQCLAVVVDKTIGRLCPLQDDIRTVLGVIGKETMIYGRCLE